MTQPTPIPPRAAAALQARIEARNQADAVLAQAIALVLASLDLPPETRIEVQPDGSMVALPPKPEPAPAA